MSLRSLCGLVSGLLVGALLGAAPALAQVETEVSDATGTTRIESTGMRALTNEQYDGSHAAFRAAYVDAPDAAPAWVLTVYGFADTTTSMSRSNRLRVQAGGRWVEPTRLTSKTRRVDGTLLEIKRAVFSRPAFEAIAGAQTVTITVGAARFATIHARLKDLRLILERVPRDGGAPRTASTDSSGGR